MVKRIIFLLFTLSTISLTLCGQSAFSQKEHRDHKEGHDHKGRFFIGGVINYWNDTDKKSHSLELAPEFGYLFNDTWGVGVFFSYDYSAARENRAQFFSHSYSITPFVRYYYFHRLPFNLYLDTCVGGNWSTEKHQQLEGLGGIDVERANGFEIGVRPGACVDLTEGLCLCLRLGFIGYRNRFFAGEEEGIGNSGWGIRFAPEELNIGLELEF